MRSKDIIFVGGISYKRKILGGATVKNRYFIKWLKKKHISLYILDTDNWKKNIISILFKLFYIFVILKTDKIILSTSANGSYYFLKFSHIFNIKNKKIYYFMIGGNTPIKLKTGKFKLKYYKSVKKIYVETCSMKKMMNNFGLQQVEYLPNFKKFCPKFREKKYITYPLKAVFFSRIDIEKGTELIFQMLDIINKKETKLVVDFFGPINDKYKNEFLKKVKLNKNTHYQGVINTMHDDTFEVLGKYDFMLFPTYWEGEGFPGCIIDAFIASLPVVASDWNYNKEILSQNTGYLFKAKDIKDFCKIIHSIIIQPELLLEKRKNCFKEALKYNIDKVLESVVVNFKNIKRCENENTNIRRL